MPVFAIVLLRQPRDPKEWNGILSDRVIWVSTDLEKTRAHFQQIDGDNWHFNATYFKPIQKIIVETQENQEFPDHLVNEKQVASEAVNDVPLADLLAIYNTRIAKYKEYMVRIAQGLQYWTSEDQPDLHNVAYLPAEEQIQFFEKCIAHDKNTVKILKRHYE